MRCGVICLSAVGRLGLVLGAKPDKAEKLRKQSFSESENLVD